MVGTPEMMKKVNMNLIYKVLMEVSSATRQELVEKTNISLTTIRAVLEELLENEQIIQTRLDQSSGGRRAQRYALNPQKNLILSICVNRENLIYQVFNLNRGILETNEVIPQGMNLTDCIMNLLEKCMKKWSICAVGIGVPGIVEKGKFYIGNEIYNLTPMNIGEAIQAKYHIPVVLENDLNTVAYGYATRYIKEHSECQKEKVNLAYIHFNQTCTGAGFVVGGKVLHGARQFAGELGFMPLEEGRTLDQVMQSQQHFEEYIDTVSRTLAIINYVTNPALIVLGGERFAGDTEKSQQVEQYLKQNYLEQDFCPSVVTANCYEEDFLLGLEELTRNHILSLLPF